MGMAELNEALALIEDNEEEASFVGPIAEAWVTKAEEALGLAFPPTYRAFLLRLGCGNIGGAEFYGIVHDDFENCGIPGGIGLTLEERESADLPATHVLVGSTGDGAYYAIDCSSRTGGGESPVVEWWPGLGQQQPAAEDFGQFLLEKVQETQEG